MNNRLLILLFTICFSSLKAQKSETTFGLQYKPIIPISFFDASNIEGNSEGYFFDLKPKYSYSMGMVIRHKINHTFSVESGLNYIQRNFKLGILKSDSISIDDYTEFGMRTYELPLQLLAYVQIKEAWFVNAAFGISYNTLASDIYSEGNKIEGFYQNTYRKHGGYMALLANVGLEYRTIDKGNYYFGASLHRPFENIAYVVPEYELTNFNDASNFYLEMLGNFISIDFRYFFAE